MAGPHARRPWLPGVSLGAAVFLLIGSVFLLNLNLAQLRDSFGWVEHTDNVLLQVTNLENDLLQAETSGRAYVLTGDDTYLNDFHDAADAVRTRPEQLAHLVADNPDQVRRVAALEPLVRRRIVLLNQIVDTGPARRADVANVIRNPENQRLNTAIRASVDALRQAEIALLSERQRGADSSGILTTSLGIGTGLLALAAAALGLFLFQRENNRHRLRELHSELRHVSRLNTMGQTAATLAHELNQPLAATGNYLQALRRLIETAPDQREKIQDSLQKAIAQVGRAGGIVRRLRDFVDKKESRRTLVAPQALVADAIALLSTIDESLRLETRIAPNLPLLRIDKVQLQQVLVNLLRNAIEAMAGRPRRELLVAAAPEGESAVRFSLQDSGPGLAKEVADNLFKPFVTTKTEGMGIGLSICQTIVAEHGGRIWVEPNPAGGTIFHFTLPAAGGE
jgi:C4-dicarboxylate-specific signal transduction histidine kinase